MSKNLPYYVAFSHCLGIGPMRFAYLVKRYHTLEKAYTAPARDLIEPFGLEITERFNYFRRHFDPLKKIDELKNKGIQIISQEDPHYFSSLRELTDKPICLYVKGQLSNYPAGQDLLFAIVGTRKSSDYGEYLAKTFSSILASANCVIVSGMAIGIDGEAHKAALEVGGRTIAFLGCGVDIVYPPQNEFLYKKIINSGGLVISEFPPGQTVTRGLFVARNRLIAGVSKAVLVVEGTKDSGALITARDAAHQHKEVYILPVPLNSKLSEGPISLIEDGAVMVVSPQELLSVLHLDPHKNIIKEIDYSKLELDERDIVELLSFSPRSIDELTERLNSNVIQNMNLVSALELKGLIVKNKEGKYQLKT